MNTIYKIVFTFCFAIALSACAKKQDDSLQNIRERKQLTVLIQNNSMDYFIYRGYPMGYQLELLQLFSKYLDTKLHLIPVNDLEVTPEYIRQEHIDLIASNITVTDSRKEKFCFSHPICPEQNLTWGFLCDADSLSAVVNIWIDSMAQTKKFAQLYHKYYVQPRHGYLHSDHSSLKKGRISIYDEIIKKYAERLNWDWRLLAALIYQESHFLKDQTSWAGAIGLMQLMPATAEKYGITLESSADEQILAGVKYLREIDKVLPPEIPESERTAFILASYNVGIGHILDARRLAVKYDKDPNVWLESVEVELLKKSDRTILRDTVIRNGYARGEETYDFVRDIFMRWHHYQNLIP